MRVINDIHLGAQRSAGTTPASAWALDGYVKKQFHKLVHAGSGELVVLGDLFDTGNVPYGTLLFAYSSLLEYAETKGNHLHLVAGNHDLTRDTTLLSSFAFLCKLFDRHPRVTSHFAPGWLGGGAYVIPHLPNQEAFNTALAGVPECKFLLLHCNIDSPFAVHSDHSLNATTEQLDKVPAQFVVCAHEHQAKQTGKVWLPGNQIPTSVSDCLGERTKFYTKLSDGVEFRPFLPLDGVFARVNWKELSSYTYEPRFLRVQGKATAEEAAAATAAIAAYRRRSDCFVVSNAVEFEEVDGSDFAAPFKDAKAFDLMGALREHLSEEEMEMLA